MFRVGADAERRVLTELQYCEPALVQSDLKDIRSVFSDLRLYCDVYCFPNKQKKRLLFLAGTLPVSYQGAQYNLPVCLWLHQTHPAARPRCCVCPSVSMAINPHCRYVDAHGNILLPRLLSWTQGRCSLLTLASEMKQAFEKDTPLYSRPLPLQQTTPPESGVRSGPGSGESPGPGSSSGSSPGLGLSPGALKWPAHSEKRSYCEDLKDIDFSPNHRPIPVSPAPGHAPSDVTDAMTALRLSPSSQSERRDQTSNQSERSPNRKPTLRPEWEEQLQLQMRTQLPPQKLHMFLQLLQGRSYTAEGRSYSMGELLEAVRLNEDLPSAQRYLHHLCPVCQEHVSFSKMVLMTLCSCALCESCFKSWFSSVIKERSVEHFVCPLCGKPDFSQNPELDLDYFSLLDTQIRHFLSSELHDLFQRKLRDRALSHMTHFCWCSHCSFGVVLDSGSLRMDCPSCYKSTCSRCRSPWTEEHQGVSCEDFRARTQSRTGPLFSCIECPVCGELYSGSKGGCLHFSCPRCGTDFCGGCSQRFVQGQSCQFSASCSSRGLHAHHPRDCVYHLRDWRLPRLHLLLQFYRVSPSCIEEANHSAESAPASGLCPVLELRDGSETPCGKPAPPGLYRGYCRPHYVEQIVSLLNAVGADPLVLFSSEEAESELRRWNLPLPPRAPPEGDLQYHARLTQVVLQKVPLRKRSKSTAAVFTPVSAPPEPGLNLD